MTVGNGKERKEKPVGEEFNKNKHFFSLIIGQLKLSLSWSRSRQFLIASMSQICRWHKDFLIDFHPMMRQKCM
jgi:hypothetical protein